MNKKVIDRIKDNDLIIDLNKNSVKGYTTKKDLKKQMDKLKDVI